MPYQKPTRYSWRILPGQWLVLCHVGRIGMVSQCHLSMLSGRHLILPVCVECWSFTNSILIVWCSMSRSTISQTFSTKLSRVWIILLGAGVNNWRRVYKTILGPRGPTEGLSTQWIPFYIEVGRCHIHLSVSRVSSFHNNVSEPVSPPLLRSYSKPNNKRQAKHLAFGGDHLNHNSGFCLTLSKTHSILQPPHYSKKSTRRARQEPIWISSRLKPGPNSHMILLHHSESEERFPIMPQRSILIIYSLGMCLCLICCPLRIYGPGDALVTGLMMESYWVRRKNSLSVLGLWHSTSNSFLYVCYTIFLFSLSFILFNFPFFPFILFTSFLSFHSFLSCFSFALSFFHNLHEGFPSSHFVLSLCLALTCCFFFSSRHLISYQNILIPFLPLSPPFHTLHVSSLYPHANRWLVTRSQEPFLRNENSIACARSRWPISLPVSPTPTMESSM